MIVDDLRSSFADGKCEISARVRQGGSELPRLYFRFPEQFAPARLDGSPFLAGLLVYAMRAGEDITLDAPVSPRLLDSLDRIFAVYSSFFPGEMRPISVEAPASTPPPATELTGSFFSRGVDSWFAVLTALEDDPQTPPLTHLVFCPDFLPRDSWSDELVELKTAQTRQAAAPTGCEFIIVETNQKPVYRGHQLVAMALALGFSRMLIPSSGMLGELIPRATHPDLDPLFSSERTEIHHYGNASRMQKVARVARSTDALRTLRVCRYNRADRDINCGRCEKCLRTMIHLHLVGALERARGLFEHPLEPQAVAAMSKEIKHPHQWVDLLCALDDTPEDHALGAAIRLVIIRAHLRNAYEQVREHGADPELSALRPDLPEALKDAYEVVRLIHRGLDPEAPPQGPTRRRVMRSAVTRAVRIDSSSRRE
ncbi:MAG: hypothetical protein ACJ76S_03990 [Solirubrobacteraceae bacterium]